MLSTRLSASPRAAVRASHAIRSTTSEHDWLRIDSTNIDDIVAQPLPAPEKQLAKLVTYLRDRAGDAHFAEVDIDDMDALSAIVGAVDGESLMRLVEWATQDGLLKVKDGGKKLTLTPKAWASAGSQQDEGTVSSKKEIGGTAMKATRGHCPVCGPDRRAEVKASHQERWDDDEVGVWAVDTYNILKCGGCDAIYVQHENLFSEDIDYRQTADGGWEQVASPKTSYWPSPSKRNRPDWLDEIEDDTLQSVLTEVYGALDIDHRILAAIGARTSLDRAMVLLGATADNFPAKLTELEGKGIVSTHEKEQLLVLTDAGNASAHRAWHPTPKNLDTVMSGMESFLHRTLVFGKDISAVRKDIPPRPKVPKGGKSD